MNGYDDSEKKPYWTTWRKGYWAFAIIFSVLSLSYVGFYAVNIKECTCKAPIPCNLETCPLGDYYMYTTDSCEVACDSLGGFVSNITIAANKSVEEASFN